MKPTPMKPKSIMAQVAGSGTADARKVKLSIALNCGESGRVSVTVEIADADENEK